MDMENSLLTTFRVSEGCIHGLKQCCLFAEFRNQIVPGLADRYGTSQGTESEFEVFIRGLDLSLSPWQQQVLKRLFLKDEISVAIEQGFSEFEKEWKDHYRGFENDFADMKRDGLIAHLLLRRIVIDERKREVVLGFHTDSLEPLVDDGVSIILKQDRWRFEVGRYLDDFISEVSSEEIARRVGRLAKTYDSTVGGPDEFPVGLWVCDEGGTRRMYELIGATETEARLQLDARLDFEYEFESSRVLVANSNFRFEHECIAKTSHGCKLLYQLKLKNVAELKQMTLFWLEDLLLDFDQGIALRRKH